MEQLKINTQEKKEKNLTEEFQKELSEKIQADLANKEKGMKFNPDLIMIKPELLGENEAKIWERLKNLSTLEEGKEIIRNIREKLAERMELEVRGEKIDPGIISFWAYFSNMVMGPVGKMELDEIDRLKKEQK